MVGWVIVTVITGHDVLRHKDCVGIQFRASIALGNLENALLAISVIPAVNS